MVGTTGRYQPFIGGPHGAAPAQSLTATTATAAFQALAAALTSTVSVPATVESAAFTVLTASLTPGAASAAAAVNTGAFGVLTATLLAEGSLPVTRGIATFSVLTAQLSRTAVLPQVCRRALVTASPARLAEIDDCG